MEIGTFKQKFENSLNFFREEIKSIRTGRATPALVEDLKVNYYSTPTPLKQVASINIPEPRLIVISPYDKSVFPEIEKAISESDLGLTPTNDGNVIRISVPSLNEERRGELIKVIGQKAEEAKVAMRNIRREAIEQLEKEEKDGDISEDDKFKSEKEVQESLDSYINLVSQAVENKEKEIKEI